MTMPQPNAAASSLERLRIQRPDAPPTGGSPRRWGSKLAALAILLIASVVGWLVWSISGDQQESRWAMISSAMQRKVEVRLAKLTVEKGQAADANVVATGYLKSHRQAKIGARAPGRIQEVTVEEGTRVTTNQVLAVLEHADLDAALAAAQATLAGAQSQLAEQTIEIDRKRTDRDRAELLHKTHSVSDADLDRARFDYQSAVARRDSIAANIKLAEARVREAEQMKENMFIRAPFDGTVVTKDAEVGESILPGGMGEASGRGSVVTIADLQHLEVECDVKEDFIGRVVVERPAEVAVDAVPNVRYHGVVMKVIPMGDRARATIKVKVAIVDADQRLFPDMSATVYFLPDPTDQPPVDSDKPRIFCENDAIREDGERRFVWTLDDKARLQQTDVTLGATRDRRTEILSGLQGSERVVIAPPDARPNDNVKLLDI